MTDQAAYEQQLVQEGKDRRRLQHERYLRKNQLTYTARGRHLVSKGTEDFEDWLALWREKCRSSVKIHPEERRIYDAITNVDLGWP